MTQKKLNIPLLLFPKLERVSFRDQLHLCWPNFFPLPNRRRKKKKKEKKKQKKREQGGREGTQAGNGIARRREKAREGTPGYDLYFFPIVRIKNGKCS